MPTSNISNASHRVNRTPNVLEAHQTPRIHPHESRRRCPLCFQRTPNSPLAPRTRHRRFGNIPTPRLHSHHVDCASTALDASAMPWTHPKRLEYAPTVLTATSLPRTHSITRTAPTTGMDTVTLERNSRIPVHHPEPRVALVCCDMHDLEGRRGIEDCLRDFDLNSAQIRITLWLGDDIHGVKSRDISVTNGITRIKGPGLKQLKNATSNHHRGSNLWTVGLYGKPMSPGLACCGT